MENNQQLPEQNVQTQPQHSVQQPKVIVNNQYVEKPSNGIGTAGFILALIALVFSWLPGVNWFIWFLGFLLSFIGMFKKPRGLAIAGFLISCIDLLIIIAIVGAIGAFLAAL